MRRETIDRIAWWLPEIAGSLALAVLVCMVLWGCSPAPARNRITPGTAGVERTIERPSSWRIEIRHPREQRVYVPTEAEEVDG